MTAARPQVRGLATRRRSARRRLALLLVVGVLTSCGGVTGLHARFVTGVGRRHVNVVVDDLARPAFAGAVTAYWRNEHIRVIVRSGTSAAIAQAVKFGTIVDLVVIAGGPPLARIRDELTAHAMSLGTYRGVGYWAAPVTDVGVRYVSFLRSRVGVAALRAGGLTA